MLQESGRIWQYGVSNWPEKGFEVLKAALSERAAPQPTICAGS